MSVLILLGGCQSVAHMDTSMTMQNLMGPFVTKDFAERLALLVLEEKYSRDVFSARAVSDVTDKGDIWLVTVENDLPSSPGSLAPRRFIVHIKKRNGEITAIT
jgi:hypothetical protein